MKKIRYSPIEWSFIAVNAAQRAEKERGPDSVITLRDIQRAIDETQDPDRRRVVRSLEDVKGIGPFITAMGRKVGHVVVGLKPRVRKDQDVPQEVSEKLDRAHLRLGGIEDSIKLLTAGVQRLQEALNDFKLANGIGVTPSKPVKPVAPRPVKTLNHDINTRRSESMKRYWARRKKAERSSK